MPGINLSTPQDIIAAVPYMLGFHPGDSLVIMALTAKRVAVTFRYDLPDPAASGDLTGKLAGRIPVILAQHKADAVVLLGYGPAGRVRPVLDAAVASVAGLLTIREVLLITGTRFWSLQCAECCPPEGIEIDSAATVPAAELTALGFAPFGSRDDLRASIAPLEGDAARAMRAAVSRAEKGLPPVGADGPDTRHVARLRELLAPAVPLSDTDTGELLVLLGYRRLRDEAWALAGTGDPDSQVGFWTDVTRRAPASHAAPPACLLAYSAACMIGDGVLARIAVDHALGAEPGYILAQLLQMMLDTGIDPSRCRLQATAADLEPVPGPPAS
jgi:hypothetical protein